MKLTKIVSILLCLGLVLCAFAGCDNTNTNSDTDTNANTSSVDNEQYIDDETGEIINIGSSTTMKITPEEIGTLANPVVRGLEAWPNEDNIKWKEEAYGFIYDYDTCDGSSRHAKWVSAFVAGDAYDVLPLLSTDFPILAQRGLLQPLDKILPAYDENYFNQTISNAFTWKGRCYGVNAMVGIDEFGFCSVNTYGIHYNATLFENAGEDTPMDYYNRGEWTFDTMYDLIKTMTNVNGSADDVYGMVINYSYMVQCAVASNGGSLVKYTDTGAEMNLKDPKTMEALEWVNEVRQIANSDAYEALNMMQAGKTAMHIERPHQLNTLRNSGSNYEYGWVPFPLGPSGEGLQTGLGSAWAISKGAKNIEGALAWITCEPYRSTYLRENGIEVEKETRTAEEIALCDEAFRNSTINSVEGFGFGLWQMLEDAYVSGMAAAIEKHTPTFQAQINAILETQEEEGAIEFIDQGVFDFDTAESEYPFVNVIGDDKFTYGTEEIQSLKIDLSGMSEFSAIAYTDPGLFKLQTGGQYKVSFRLLCDVDPGAETLAIAARTTDALDGSPTFGLTWLTPRAGEATDVEVFINVNDSFNGELAVVLLGSATEANPDLSFVIDDFRVELIAGE